MSDSVQEPGPILFGGLRCGTDGDLSVNSYENRPLRLSPEKTRLHCVSTVLGVGEGACSLPGSYLPGMRMTAVLECCCYSLTAVVTGATPDFTADVAAATDTIIAVVFAAAAAAAASVVAAGVVASALTMSLLTKKQARAYPSPAFCCTIPGTRCLSPKRLC